MQKPPETFFNAKDFMPELREIFAQPPLDPRKTVLVAAPVKNPDDHGGRFIPAESERNLIGLTDGRMLWMALPYAVTMTLTGLWAITVLI
jgi:hypothetical protein